MSILPDEAGEASGCNFEKAHSVLQKVQLPASYHVI